MGTTYCTAQQLASHGLAQRIIDTIPPEDVTAALGAASAQVDSYIGRVFNLPLLAYGAELTQATASLAAYNLMSVRGFQAGGSDQAETLEKRNDRAVTWLKDIAAGRAKPSWPDTKTASGYNPTAPATVLSPSAGGIGIHGGSFLQDGNDSPSATGSVTKGKLRGW